MIYPGAIDYPVDQGAQLSLGKQQHIVLVIVFQFCIATLGPLNLTPCSHIFNYCQPKMKLLFLTF